MLNMRSRCFITPKNLSFVEAVLDMLEKHGVAETMIRNHTPGFVELEVLGWNLLSVEKQVLILVKVNAIMVYLDTIFRMPTPNVVFFP